jgi:hypothetical protein
MVKMFHIAQAGRSRVLTAIIAGIAIASVTGVGTNGRWRP